MDREGEGEGGGADWEHVANDLSSLRLEVRVAHNCPGQGSSQEGEGGGGESCERVYEGFVDGDKLAGRM